MEERQIPIISWTIDEEDMNMGVDAISFVSDPATQVNWQKFNQKNLHFEKDKVKRIVTGPVMLANTLIYRYSPMIGEYYGKFNEETIEKMMIKYFKDNKIHRVNEEHTSNKTVKGVYLVESFIVGDRTKSNVFDNLPKGSWIASFYVEDEKYWNEKIMSDEFSGFSLEGAFFENIEEEMVTEVYNKIKDLVYSSKNDKEFKRNLEKLIFQSYNDYPKAASENACKVLRWIDEHGRDEVEGMTQTGLARANQLCKRENITRDTIARMAAFERHRKNSEIDEEYKGTPWKDKGYVSWLGWGGTEGIEWAQRKLKQIDRDKS